MKTKNKTNRPTTQRGQHQRTQPKPTPFPAARPTLHQDLLVLSFYPGMQPAQSRPHQGTAA